MVLKKGLTDHVATYDEGLSHRAPLWLTIYCNKSGLLDILMKNRICNSDQFENFFHGFNQASPLFSIVDVGSGKEAADAKIRGTSMRCLVYVEIILILCQNVFEFSLGFRRPSKYTLEVREFVSQQRELILKPPFRTRYPRQWLLFYLEHLSK